MEAQSLTPAEIFGEIRTRYQQLKDLLKRNGNKVWEQEVEFQRQKCLRKFQLQLLFKHSSAKEARDMDNQLWMTTSHSFISGYKAHLALLEREKPHAPPTNGKGKPTKNIVEKRKALQRFKRFLNGEERFWKAFVLRYTDYFGMEQPKQLSSLTTLPEGEPDDGPGEHNLFPEGKAAITSERKHDREHRLAVVSKALICLGDLARYREQQKEQYVSDFPSRGRGGRPVHNLSRPNSYSKSQEFYEMARLLVPDSGNSSHQLAILANSQKDTFTAVYHYYRSLCVRSPFETAAENLQTTLNKALENYIKSLDTAEEGLAPRALAEKLKEKVVILHSTWRMSSDEVNTKFPDLQSSFTTDFTSLVSDRTLTLETILKMTIMAIGALWRIRLVKDNKKDKDPNGPEFRIVIHMLSIFTSLLRIGVLQVNDAPELQGSGEAADLALGITVVFRRTLPAMRIVSKWIRAHLPYLITLAAHRNASPQLITAVTDLWVAYQAFHSNLWKNFPLGKLPKLSNPLEEDVELCGFVPLKRTMNLPSTQSANGLDPGQSQVHPNEEHLMRICDLLQDALEVSRNERSPVAFNESQNRFIFKGIDRPKPPSSPKKQQRPPSQPAPPPAFDPTMIPPSVKSHALLQQTMLFSSHEPKDDMDDAATTSTRTDDDPVNLAMKASLDSDLSDHEMDDEEEILYPKQALATPINSFASISPRMAAMTISPSLARLSLPASPTSSFQLPTPRKLTHGESPLSRGAINPDPSWTVAAQPPLLFGSGSGEASSIWSTKLDDAAAASASPLALNFGGSPVPPPPKFASLDQHASYPHSSRWPSSLSQSVPPLTLDEPFHTNSPANFLNSSQRSSAGMGFQSQPFGINTGVYPSSPAYPFPNQIGGRPAHEYAQMPMEDMRAPPPPNLHDPFQANYQHFIQPHQVPPPVQSRSWAPH